MTATALRPDVAAYVADVRAHLDDLGPDVVEELTGGLAADLSDLAAESADPLVDRLGPPKAYADELRAAAQLPPPAAPGSAGGDGVARLRSSWDANIAGLRRHPRWPAVAGFAAVVRPAWWVARAFLAFGLLRRYGTSLGLAGLLLLLTLMILVSVQLGRGRWRRQRWLTPLVLLGNVLAVLLTPAALAAVLSPAGHDSYAPAPAPAFRATGLWTNGEPVSNIFAYDSSGKPLTDVQLFDGQGRPLSLDPGQFDGSVDADGRPRAFHVDAYGREVWNVFPVPTQRVTNIAGTDGTAPSTAVPLPSVPPLAAVPPSGSASVSPPTPTPTVTTTPTPRPPTPTATPRAPTLTPLTPTLTPSGPPTTR